MKHDYKPARRYDSSTQPAETGRRTNRQFIALTMILLVAVAAVLTASIYEYKSHKTQAAPHQTVAKTVTIPLKIKNNVKS